ncbi:uncharacterized protein LY89DRAFT_731051 [Mollisia scopiformis]|uniref:BTB domain-containing protein n=1 Tax=Mollisia scopiformis TaxID=149040 RepID=A0A194XI13_MOLSC|nr:uncharacterized protein LY89DRAFT_731051 [Mollisia scopiformis]KUJ19798.1 hypothetical protein LY89DRAFT_731051 [Mollisia scopiformis]
MAWSPWSSTSSVPRVTEYDLDNSDEACKITPAVPQTLGRVGKQELDFSPMDEIVTFHVGSGDDEKKFIVHKSLACQVSPVWEKAFNRAFIEGQTLSCTLLDVKPNPFTLLVKWIYGRDLDTEATKVMKILSGLSGSAKDDENEKLQKTVDDQDISLIQLWILADRLLIPHLQGDVIKILKSRRAASQWNETESRRKRVSLYRPSYQWFPTVFENTKLDSPLRDYTVHQAVFYLDAKTFQEHPECFPKALLLRYAEFTTERTRRFQDMHVDIRPSRRPIRLIH